MSKVLENLRRKQERGELSREAVEAFAELFKMALDIHNGDEEAAKREVAAWLSNDEAHKRAVAAWHDKRVLAEARAPLACPT